MNDDGSYLGDSLAGSLGKGDLSNYPFSQGNTPPELEVISNQLDSLHKKINSVMYEVQQLTAAMEELLPAARRAAAMMDKSKTVKLMELLKAGSPPRRG